MGLRGRRLAGPGAWALVFVLVAAALAAAAAEAGSASGILRKARARFETATASTTSGSFVEMPLTKMAFNSTRSGMVRVELCGMFGVVGDTVPLFLEARLDGVPLQPFEVILAQSDPAPKWLEMRCTTWVRGNVAPGSHQVRIRWKTIGGEARVMDRILTVWHAG